MLEVLSRGATLSTNKLGQTPVYIFDLIPSDVARSLNPQAAAVLLTRQNLSSVDSGPVDIPPFAPVQPSILSATSPDEWEEDGTPRNSLDALGIPFNPMESTAQTWLRARFGPHVSPLRLM